MEERDDVQHLIEGARNGSHEHFRGLYERYVDRLFSYVRSHTKSRSTALDVVQDTFVDLWQTLPTFSYRSEEEFLGFLFVIVKRKLARHYQKEIREQSVVLSYDHEPSHEEHREDYRHILHALEHLSQNYQDVLRLRYWGDLTFSEIGKTLGIREEAARILHHRALKKLEAITPQ